MATRLVVAVLLLALLHACATPSGVRLDTGQGTPVEYTSPTWGKPVQVDPEAFEQALRQLAQTEPLTLRSPQQGWLVRASYPGFDADIRWQRLMSQSFGGFCKPGQRRTDGGGHTRRHQPRERGSGERGVQVGQSAEQANVWSHIP
jgi:hypothetical protein